MISQTDTASVVEVDNRLEVTGEVAQEAANDFLGGIKKLIREYEEDLADDTMLG